LEKFLPSSPLFSKVVYNGLSDGFKPGSIADARLSLTDQFKIDLNPGYLLHVGGNQWYKNRTGVILLYSQWREHYGMKLPLILIGHPPSDQLLESYHQSPFNADIHFISNVDDDTVKLAYCGASVFLFPSLAEGFGWPIAEALASGTIVITTNEAPMTEVAGEAGFLIERMPKIGPERENWLIKSTAVLQEAITLTEQERAGWVLRGVNNTRRFRMDETLDQLEIYYKDIMSDYDLKN
jgi:glycosyltransferase involved in cell wall biosynthesis